MKIYAFFMLLGCFLTLLIPETKRITLEKLAGEKEDSASGITETTINEKAEENGSEKAPPV